MDDRIMTLHPAGKQGVRIDRDKYEAVKSAILAVVGDEATPFQGLVERVGVVLGDSFTGSVGWYTTTVKLDLEARGLLERVPGPGPQRLRRSVSG